MLFKRKNKQSIWSKLRDFIWPRSGWKRSLLYLKHRILRLPHSARDISMGLAAGCVVSWTPTLGVQILQCFIFCKITRANFFASVVGTVFGNPWTFPILFWIAHIVGSYFLEITGLYKYFLLMGADTVVSPDHEYEMVAYIPTLVGGYIMAVLTFPIFYYVFYYLITGARAAKTKVGEKVHVIGEKVHDMKEHRKEVKQAKKDAKKK